MSRRLTIGFLACDIAEEVSRALWQGAAEAARELGVNLICYPGGALRDPLGYRKQSNVLYSLVDPRRVDGIILVSSSIDFAASRAEMETFIRQFEGLPLVSIEEEFPGIPSLLKDEFGGMAQVVDHLIATHSRRKIVFMQGPGSTLYTQKRFQAYQETLSAHGLPFDPNLVTPPTNSWSFEEARITFRTFLEERALRPRFDFDAVAAVNDENAYAAVEVLKELGVRVPDDISVTGFDDLAIGGSIAPPLTTVRFPFPAIASSAVEILLARMRGEEFPGPDGAAQAGFCFPAQMVVRHSCGCLLPTIAEAAAPRPDARAAEGFAGAGRLAATIAVQRRAIALEMARAVGGSPLAQQGSVQLLNGLIGEFDHGTPGAFLSALDEVLNLIGLNGERIKEWQQALSVLRLKVRPYLIREGERALAENLWHQARVMVGEAAWRNQSLKRLNAYEYARELRLLGARLATARELDELMEILEDELPGLGIPRCYLSLYENPAHPAGHARLILGYDEQGSLRIPPEGRVFASAELAPAPVWTRSERSSLLVEPLYLRTEQLGLAVFEADGLEGGRESELWGALQIQISSALKSVLLHREAANARREAEAGWQLAEERRRAAEEANQLKSRFLSMVSHEMRTPLNVIAGLSESLIQQKDSPEAALSPVSARDLERIRTNAQHLDRLIRDVLDLAVSQVGQLKLACENLDVADVLESIFDTAARMAADKGLSWRVEIQPGLPRIYYDRTRLRQVVLNLVSNAVKFTEQGEVALSIRAEGRQVLFTLADSGLGISRDEQGLIFEEFHRSARASARGYGGMGLGLAITRRLVELGGGQIGVESSGLEGSGSTFHFTLPAVQDRPPLDGLPPLEQAEGGEPALILLLSEGSPGPQLAARLREGGFEVQTLRIDQNENWLQLAQQAAPGALVLDFDSSRRLTGTGQGWEAVNVLKAHPVLRDVPILFCSLTQEHGAVIELNYLEKPLNSAQLLRALEQHGLRLGGTPFDAVPNGTAPPGDILLVDDDPVFLDLHARLIYTQMPDVRVRKARSGREALAEMQRSRPALVLLDLLMPEMNGFELLKEMQASESLRGVPAVVMTSQKLTEHEMQQFSQGVVAVLEKGLFTPAETFGQLKAALERSKRLGSEARRVARQAMAYIHEHYRDPLSRKDLAENGSVSQEYLSTCFHRETGVTPSDYLERYRIKQAKRLLETTDQPITGVAMEVGFYDSSYFGRVFRREVGVTPLAYRRGERK